MNFSFAKWSVPTRARRSTARSWCWAARRRWRRSRAAARGRRHRAAPRGEPAGRADRGDRVHRRGAEQPQHDGTSHALSNLTPGVNLDAGAPFSGDKSVLSASIRGIGQDDFAFNLNPGVGVYLDGVYLARTIGANLNLLDVDRIEILKGPQGTLFGANTIGGAISVVTHTPGNEAALHRHRHRRGIQPARRRLHRRHPDHPDTLLSSITVSSQNQTGWVKVIPYPSTTRPRGRPRSSSIRRPPIRRPATRPTTTTAAPA